MLSIYSSESELKDKLRLIADATEQLGIDYLNSLDSKNYRLTLIDTEGKVIFDSHFDKFSMENHKSREEIKEAFNTGIGNSIRYSSTLTEQTIYEAIKLKDNNILRISVSRATTIFLLLKML